MDFSVKVLQILRNLREIALSQWGTVEIIRDKGAGAYDVVTEVDFAVENQARTALAEAYPGIPFVGEEEGGDRNAEQFWLMDPIDATGHYVRGLPFTTIMLAYIEAGQVEFSAIYDFVNDKMYWAERGKGAYCNEEKIHVSNRTLTEGYVAFESRFAKEENRNKRIQLHAKTGSVVETISAGWELAMVAAGRLDGRICYDPYGKDYDYAPGSLLIAEAGGIVANIGDTSYDYRNRNFIATNPVIFKELTEGEDAIFPFTK